MSTLGGGTLEDIDHGRGVSFTLGDIDRDRDLFYT